MFYALKNFVHVLYIEAFVYTLEISQSDYINPTEIKHPLLLLDG